MARGVSCLEYWEVCVACCTACVRIDAAMEGGGNCLGTRWSRRYSLSFFSSSSTLLSGISDSLWSSPWAVAKGTVDAGIRWIGGWAAQYAAMEVGESCLGRCIGGELPNTGRLVLQAAVLFVLVLTLGGTAWEPGRAGDALPSTVPPPPPLLGLPHAHGPFLPFLPWCSPHCWRSVLLIT